MNYKIGVDIGGTNIKAAVIKNDLYIIERVKCRTNLPRTGKEIEGYIENLIRILLNKTHLKLEDIKSVGIGAPGIVDFKKKIIKYSCNFNWYDKDIVNGLEKKFKKTVFLENDANVAAVGEYIYNGYKRIDSMIVITLGTGIGAGIIIKDRLYRGFNLSAAEVGHMVIRSGGRRCSCGQRGCFERYASANGILKTTKEVIKKYKDSILWDYLKERGRLTVKSAFEAAKRKDVAALKIIKIFVEDLSVGVSNLINIFQPQVFIIGGGVSKEGGFFIKALKKAVLNRDYAKKLKNRCELKISKIGNDAGLIGAANIFKFV